MSNWGGWADVVWGISVYTFSHVWFGCGFEFVLGDVRVWVCDARLGFWLTFLGPQVIYGQHGP